jgi:hypothetical protein
MSPRRHETLRELHDNFITAAFALGCVTLGAAIVSAVLR